MFQLFRKREILHSLLPVFCVCFILFTGGCDAGKGARYIEDEEETTDETTTTTTTTETEESTAGPPSKITLAANPESITGTNPTTTVTATVTDDNNQTVADGTTVYFEFTDDSTAGFADESTITASSTTISGQATATVTPGTTGSATNILVVNAYTSESVQAASPLSINVSGITFSLSISGDTTVVAGGSATVTATVKTASDEAVTGQAVAFTTTAGTLSSASATTGGAGTASVSLSIPAGSTGKATVTAQIASQSISASQQITINPYQVTISPITDLKANGIDSRTVRVNVSDGSGTAPQDPVIVGFHTSLGSITTADATGVTNSDTANYESLVTSETDINGEAVAKLSALNTSGTATVTAYILDNLTETASSVVLMTQTASATFTAVSPYTIVLNPDQSFVTAGSGDNIDISGQVTDSGGDPIANQSVTFSTSDSTNTTITSQVTTDTSGSFDEVKFSSGTTAGIYTVTATAGSVSQTIQLEVRSAAPALIKLKDGYPDPATVRVKGTGGRETTKLVFVVTDNYDNNISDSLEITANITLESGPGGNESVSPSNGVETSNGEIAVNLISGFKTGTVKVKATVVQDTSLYAVSTGIAIVEGPLSSASIGIVPVKYNLAGRIWTGLEDDFTAYLADEAGDAVPDDTAVTFLTNETGGMFLEGSQVTVDGQAVDTLITTKNPEPFNGFVSVTAMAGGEDTIAVQAIGTDSGANYFVIGTDGAGIFKTDSVDDALRQWKEKNGSYHFVGPRVFDLVIPANSSNTIFAATSLGIFKSVNQGVSWTSARSPDNPNLPGFDPGVLVTSVTLASYYLDNPAVPVGSTADRSGRDKAETDVIIGTAGEGIYYNTSAGNTYQIIDADGVTTTGRGLNSSFITDGTPLTLFRGNAELYYRYDSDTYSYDIGFDANTNNTIDAGEVVLDEDNDLATTATAGLTQVSTLRGFPSYSWYFNDKDGDGVYDYNGSEEIVNRSGWLQSPVLSTGVYVNRLASFKTGTTDYAFAATDSGLFRSQSDSSDATDGNLGFAWTDIGDDDSDFSGVKIMDVLCNGDDLFAASASNGIFYTADSTDLAGVDWTQLTHPTASDTLLDGAGAADNNYPLTPFVESDNVLYEDVDGNAAYNYGEPVFVDTDEDGVYDTGERVIDGAASLTAGDTGVSAESANSFLKYYDADSSGTYTSGEDVFFDRNTNSEVDLTADTYKAVTCIAYDYDSTNGRLYCGTETGGVFISDDGDYNIWTALDTTYTGVDIARLKVVSQKLYVGGASGSRLVEFDNTGASPVYKSISTGQGSSKIDSSIMDRSAILFSGPISPSIFYDTTKTHVTAVPGAGETDRFVFVLFLQDDKGNPPVAGTKVEVSATNYEKTKTVDAGTGAISESETATDIGVSGLVDLTYGDTISSGNNSTILIYSIGPTFLDGDYTGDNDGTADDSFEYTRIHVKVTFPSESNYGSRSGGGEVEIFFDIDME